MNGGGELSTTNPQLIHWLLTTAALFAAIGAMGWAFYLKRLLLKEFPGSTTINAMRAEVAEFSGQIADLTERFARFQKREGMRTARDEKSKSEELKRQALAIMAEAGHGEPGGVSGGNPDDVKAALRRKLRGLQ